MAESVRKRAKVRSMPKVTTGKKKKKSKSCLKVDFYTRRFFRKNGRAKLNIVQ